MALHVMLHTFFVAARAALLSPMRLLILVLSFAIAACHSTPPPTKAIDGAGRGLIAFDKAPPQGAKTYEQPTWHKGDRFVMLRGGHQRIAFTVSEVTGQGYTLTDESNNELLRGLDLSTRGERAHGETHNAHDLLPGDTRFHWPLWVGKRWRCEYLDKTLGGAVLPIETAYEVEGLDTVVVPAGTFQALRILRTSRLIAEEKDAYLDRVSLAWYAPDIGMEVRQVTGETSMTLVEWTGVERH